MPSAREAILAVTRVGAAVFGVVGLASLARIDLLAAGWLRFGPVWTYRLVLAAALFLGLSAFERLAVRRRVRIVPRALGWAFLGWMSGILAYVVWQSARASGLSAFLSLGAEQGALEAARSIVVPPLMTFSWALGIAAGALSKGYPVNAVRGPRCD